MDLRHTKKKISKTNETIAGKYPGLMKRRKNTIRAEPPTVTELQYVLHEAR
jgi:hypothetical protein